MKGAFVLLLTWSLWVFHPNMGTTIFNPSAPAQNDLDEDVILFWCRVKDIQEECVGAKHFNRCVAIWFKGIYGSATLHDKLDKFEIGDLGSVLVSLRCPETLRHKLEFSEKEDPIERDDEGVMTTTVHTNILVVTELEDYPTTSPTDVITTLSALTLHSETDAKEGQPDGSGEKENENKDDIVPSHIPTLIISSGEDEKNVIHFQTNRSNDIEENFGKFETTTTQYSTTTIHAMTGGTDSNNSSFAFIAPTRQEADLSFYMVVGYWIIASMAITLIAGILIAILIRYEAIKFGDRFNSFIFQNITNRHMEEQTRL